MAADWRQATDLMNRAGEDRGVHQLYPDPSCRLSLVAAAQSVDVAATPQQHRAGEVLSQRLAALVAQSQSIDQIGKCPVVGITGLLNSGKSSLLAAYLSSAGRNRVLRGTANNQGTHRFVLWLPDAWWHQSDLLTILKNYLTTLFGAEPEELAEEPAIAFAQYNGQLHSTALPANVGQADKWIDPLRVPLIAHDSALDALGLALLDCPDIQTAFAVGEPTSSRRTGEDNDAAQTQRGRREQLARVGRLCSAFLVVSKLSSLHDETLLNILETLRDTMPGVRRLLAVNKVKARYAPAVVDEQARQLVQQFEIDEVYMAYDFRSHWAEYRLPPVPPQLIMDPADPLPIFFRASNAPELTAPNQTRPAQIAPARIVDTATSHAKSDETTAGLRPPVVARYLQDLSQLLSPGSLVMESRRSVLDQLIEKSAETINWFEASQAQRQRQLHDAWQAIADACFAFMAQRDDNDQAIGLRLQTSPAIVAQMSDSLVRAAPWSMRASLAIDRSVRNLQTSIAGGVRRMRWLQSASSSVSQFLGSFRRGQTGKVVTADRFRQQLQRSDHRAVLAAWTPDLLTKSCEQALARFKQEDTVRLDNQWLDDWSKELWKHMTLKRKLYVGMMPLAPIFGPLLAVTLIPFDGAGTAVLVFATTKELLLAAGIAALALPTTSGGELQDLVESETALSQLSELFAVTCDSLGLPRPHAQQLPHITLAGVPRTLAPSHLTVKRPATQAVLSTWHLAPQFSKNLNSMLSTLRTEIEKPLST